MRLFIQAKRTRGPIRWPEPTHTANGASSLFGDTERWRSAREIIDWSLPSQSIFTRKKPLKPNTLARIVAGLRKFSGLPFVVPFKSEREGQDARVCSLDRPFPTVASGGNGGLVEPFLLRYHGDHNGKKDGARRVHRLDKPIPALDTQNRYGLVEPFIIELRRNQDAASVDKPLSTVCGSGAHHALVELEKFIIPQLSGGVPRSVGKPLPTITTTSRGIGLCESYIVPVNHGRNDRRSHPIDRPMPTLTSVDAWGLVEVPFLVKYNGTAGAQSIDKPLDTISGTDRFALVIPELGAAIDIRFRMLQPHELARAMSFPMSYHFAGNRSDRVKQIGNAVPVETAKALCRTILSD